MPVLATLIAAVLIKEEIRIYHWIGGGIVLIGIIMAQRFAKQR
jgi:drug/metabolite transporter (DMT)-like permease